MKQNTQLLYFYGQNENAIRIQIRCKLSPNYKWPYFNEKQKQKNVLHYCLFSKAAFTEYL